MPIPVGKISTSEGSYLVFTRFDCDKLEPRERALILMTRFMAWKSALVRSSLTAARS